MIVSFSNGQPWAVVKVNGKPVLGCVLADTENGFVYVTKRINGKMYSEDGVIAIERLEGVVDVELPPQNSEMTALLRRILDSLRQNDACAPSSDHH